MEAFARLLVFLGVTALCSGVWLLAGYAWALVLIGVLVVTFGLLLVDVDGGGDKPT